MSQFLDIAECPKGHRFGIFRRGKSSGKVVQTYCSHCRKMFKTQAGRPTKEDKK